MNDLNKINRELLQEIAILRQRIRKLEQAEAEFKVAEKALKYLSIHDSLTGLHNRLLFDEELRRLETGRFDPIGVVICDLDGLKLVNDNLGHATGDRQLIAAANLLKEHFRSSDVVARIGGDEFAVLLSNCSSDIVSDICNRLKEAMKGKYIPGTEIPLMMSVGFATRKKAGRTNGDLLREADANMYREKSVNRQVFQEYFYRIVLHPHKESLS